MEETTSPGIAKEYLPFWEGARKEYLQFPQCGDCHRFHWYPQIICPHCQSTAIGWTKVNGRGKVGSWTVVRHPFDPAFADRIPFIVALIEFDDAPGVRLVSNLVDVSPDEIQFDMMVKPIFHSVNQDLPLVTFGPAKA